MLRIVIVPAGSCELNTSESVFSLRYLEMVKTRQSLLDHNRKHFKLNTRTCQNLA